MTTKIRHIRDNGYIPNIGDIGYMFSKTDKRVFFGYDGDTWIKQTPKENKLTNSAICVGLYEIVP